MPFFIHIIFDSVAATKFLLSAITSVSLHGIFSFAHVFLSSSYFILHMMLHPRPTPRSRSFTYIFDSVVATKFSPAHVRMRDMSGVKIFYLDFLFGFI